MGYRFTGGEDGYLEWVPDPITPAPPAPAPAPYAAPPPPAAMYSPGGQAIPTGLTAQGLQLWQSGYYDPKPPAPAPTPAPDAFQYTYTPLGSQMNGGAMTVAAAPPAPAPVMDAQAPVQPPPPPPSAMPTAPAAQYANGETNLGYTPPPPPAPWVAPNGEQPHVYSSFNDAAGHAPGTLNKYTGGADPNYAGNYSYDVNNVLDWNPPSMYGSSAENSDFAHPDQQQWQRFQDVNGQSMAAWKGGWAGFTGDPKYKDAAYTVFSDPGDFGGTGFSGQKLSKLNGIPFDQIDANGNILRTGTFDGYKDENMGDALGVGSIIAMAAGAAAGGLGGAAGATGATGGGVALGPDAFEAIAAENAATAAGGAAAGVGASQLAGGGVPKAALDGTTAFGANSVPGALDTTALSAAAPGVGSSSAVNDIVQALNGLPPTAGTPPTGVQSTPDGWQAQGNGGEYGPPPDIPDAPPPTEADVPPPDTPQVGQPPAATPPVAPPANAPGAPPPGAPPYTNQAADSQLANQQLNIPPDPNPPIPSVQNPAIGPMDSVKNAIADALKNVGLTPQQAAGLGAAITSMFGSNNVPTAGNAGQSGQQQADAAKQFLEAVMPYIRTNSNNPTGSANWTRGADGSYTLNTALNPANQGIYDDATSKLGSLVSGMDPNAKAPTLLDSAGAVPNMQKAGAGPTLVDSVGSGPQLQRAGAGPQLLDSVGGQYQSDLAQAIYDRTMSTQRNSIDTQRRAMEARLAEQGFFPGQEGYQIAMNQFEDNLNEAQNLASKDAQIQAATQALNEGKFTNDSRTTQFDEALKALGFNNTASQQEFQNLLSGGNFTNQARTTQYDEGLKGINQNNDASQKEFDDALAGSTFTNSSRTQGFKNSQDLQAQIAQILAGTRTNATAGLKDLVSSSSAPTGTPANTVAASGQQYTADLANYTSRNQAQNDLIRALMSWGLT